jgi:hypothetical protein
MLTLAPKDALEFLAVDPYTILEDAGVTGIPQEDCQDPIAIWLMANTGFVWSVTWENAEAFDPIQQRRDEGFRSHQYDLPQSIREFVQDFDQGLLPEFIDPSARWSVPLLLTPVPV